MANKARRMTGTLARLNGIVAKHPGEALPEHELYEALYPNPKTRPTLATFQTVLNQYRNCSGVAQSTHWVRLGEPVAAAPNQPSSIKRST
jgi:hypothetical protein